MYIKIKTNGKLSQLYLSIQSNKEHSTREVKLKWEREASLAISEEEWLNICSVQANSTSSGMWREFCWRNLIRYFITPKLKSIQNGETGSGLCWRKCGEQLADHFHVFWSCPTIQPYWQEVTQVIYNIFDDAIDYSFSTMYLGNLPAHLTLRDKYLLKILLATSKKALTRKWLQSEPPTKSEWLDIVTNVQNMERITFALNLRMDTYFQYWEKWIVFMSLYCNLTSVLIC